MDQENSVQENQTEFVSMPFTVAFTLFLGFSVVAFLLVFLISLTVSIIGTPFISYFVVIIFALIGGFFINHTIKKTNSKNSFSALYGVFTPFIPIMLMMGFFNIMKKTSSQLSHFADPGFTIGLGAIVNIFSTNLPNSIISSILFYLFFNLFIIIRIISDKDYRTLIFYLLVPALIFVAWVLKSVLFLSIITF